VNDVIIFCNYITYFTISAPSLHCRNSAAKLNQNKMSTTPGNNKPNNTKTPTPVKNENTQKVNRNEQDGQEKSAKDSDKSDMKHGKSDKGRS
jgi:hypothetical protein